MFRIQFSIADALATITAVAMLCAIARWAGTFPTWTILPSAFFAAACIVARRGKSPDLGWSLFALAWSVALLDMVNLLCGCCFLVTEFPMASAVQMCLLETYISSVALPIFLSCPTAYLAIKASKRTRTKARKWIILCPIIGLLDVSALTMLLVRIVGHWFD